MSMRTCLSYLSIVTILLSAGCDYGHKQFHPSSEAFSLPGPLVVEVDDYGRFWDRKAAGEVLKAIERFSEDKNTIVSVFIHGWHHNADESDDNFRDFQISLDRLTTKLREAPYVTARQQLGLNKDIHVIGLYVGWRGRALPGWLDYVTFWGRKSAAERVGDGDLREFFVKLQKVYMRRNNDASKPTFMGLLTLGHSFGGQVLFKAIAGAFERDLLNAVANAQAQPSGVPKLREIVSGLGDMTVLLNPALESFQYERIDRLTRHLSFMDIQAPVLLTVSADDDSARKYWFPIARNLNVLFRPKFQSDELKALWTTALGEYVPHQTHALEVAQGAMPEKNSVYSNCEIVKDDLTGRPVFSGGAQLSPNHGGSRYSPVVIAHTGNQLIQDHNGIFGKNFSDFLIDYVGLVQGKRLCLIRGEASATTK